MRKEPEKGKLDALVYLIRCDGQLLFATPDANKAVAESIKYSMDCVEHELEVWIGGEVVGTVELHGKIQTIFN
jgi:hypothetical protein